ncbi:hypothetical protein [Lacipirellula parvula]|uniref:Uncharacterized protein n=1 Tax=Lacipirellula parvula TaxID=2650471 RepID=A0A5K7XD84_9BACT|nr:hypothetical protein [Lacipirellula parvula]BBO34744.1 hypothetical protein PLANPX_4356 [Lacipirellula parvula]
MIGDDWITGWIIDGLAKRFGKGTVAGWITIVAMLVAVVAIACFAAGIT